MSPGLEPRVPKTRASGPDEWLSLKGFLLLLFALLALRYPQVMLGTQTFGLKDFGVFSYPEFHHARESFWRGEIPLWNPLSNCGVPYAAQWITMCFYPFTWLCLLLPMPLALNWFMLLHMMLAGAGMYQLAHQWTGHRLAASVAGLAFVFCGFMTCSTAWPAYLVALGWMPYVVLLGVRACTEGGRAIPWASAAATMQMLSGAPELILMTWAVLAVLYVVETPRSEGFRRLARIGVVVLLTTGLSAVQLLPFLELLQHSPRNVNYDISRWAMPAWGWANFLVPLFQCKLSAKGYFYQQTQQFVASYYCGAGVFLLAFAALFWRRQPRVFGLGFLLVISLFFALGSKGGIYEGLRLFVPQIGFARYTVKITALISFLVPLLCAFAIAGLADTQRARSRLVWLGSLGGALMGVILVVAVSQPLLGVDWTFAATNALWRVFFLFLFLILLARSYRANEGRRIALCLGTLLVLGIDLSTHAPGLATTVQAPVYQAAVERGPFPNKREHRVALAPSLETGLAVNIEPDLQDDLATKRHALFANFNLLEGTPAVSGFMTLLVREEDQVEEALFLAEANSRNNLLDFLGVAAYATGTNSAVWQTRPSALPLITAGQRPVFTDSTKLRWQLLAKDFNPREMVLFPAEYASRMKARELVQARLLSSTISAHQIQTLVKAPSDTVMVVAQTHYPAWKAFVDGKAVPLLRANHAFQAVEIPAGEHHVRVVYEDAKFRLGALISGVTLTICLGLFCYLRRTTPISATTRENNSRPSLTAS